MVCLRSLSLLLRKNHSDSFILFSAMMIGPETMPTSLKKGLLLLLLKEQLLNKNVPCEYGARLVYKCSHIHYFTLAS